MIVRWLDAVRQYDMSAPELAAYTMALAKSGDVLDWGDRKSAAKHAPGGVGENTSGPVDAIVAACGVLAPIFTGRRLLYTPGTVDRYGSIPGFRIFLKADEFKTQIDKIGMAMTGQTSRCAPGDGVLYALREEHSLKRSDEESLVQVPPLIIGSVLSKKIASGAKNFGLLMTFGDGAFLSDETEARETARRMQEVAQLSGSTASAVLTSMHAPLGDHLATTALAVKEGILFLQSEPVTPDYRTAILKVAATMLFNAGVSDSLESAYLKAEKTVRSGAALERFKLFIEAQGGNPRICDDLSLLPSSKETKEVLAKESGYIIPSTRHLGKIANGLANGEFRSKGFDPGAGIILTPEAHYGAFVQKGTLLARVYGGTKVDKAVNDLQTLGLHLQENEPPKVERFPGTI